MHADGTRATVSTRLPRLGRAVSAVKEHAGLGPICVNQRASDLHLRCLFFALPRAAWEVHGAAWCPCASPCVGSWCPEVGTTDGWGGGAAVPLGMRSCRTGPAFGVMMRTSRSVAPGTVFAAGLCPPAAFETNIGSAVIREICGGSRSDGQSPMVAATAIRVR
jgi:hypothetical protein